MTEKTAYSVYDQCYQGSSKISINSYFHNYRELIRTSDFYKHFDQNKKDFMIKKIGDDVDEEKYQLLEEYCSIDNLSVEGDLNKMTKVAYEWAKEPCDLSIIHNSSLRTLNLAVQRSLLKSHLIFLKYRGERPVNYDVKSQVTQNSDKALLTPEHDIFVYVRVYLPFTSRHKQTTGALGKLSLNSVIAVVGFQTLDKLRDQISCICDHSISLDISNKPVRTATKNAKDVYKSGFFFIEDTFYNDSRDPNNKDNSEIVRKWLENRNFGPFKTAPMETTRIDSLNLRFGYPWVYQHQGDCEHLITFSDARLVNGTDELSTDCYPRIERLKPRPNRYCMTCGIYSVNWVVTNNNRLPHDPCLFCDSCFKSYNYVKGKKVGSFKAYPYPYDSNLKTPVNQALRIKYNRSRTSDTSDAENSQHEEASSAETTMEIPETLMEIP